jgi:acetyltransferase-like isoleucine patch superfamily enzyme
VRVFLLGLIFVSPPFLKALLLRWFCDAKIGHKAHIGWFSTVLGRRVVLGAHSVIRPCTVVSVSGDVTLGSYSEISSFTLVYGSSSLSVGEHSYIGPQSLINVDEPIRVGDESALGPRAMLFTHGSFFSYLEGYWARRSGITIGNKVWCAAAVFIHPGVEIGDNTFVNSRSVVTQSVPGGSVVEGNPATVVGTTDRLRRKMSTRRIDAAVERILHDFAEVGLRRELGIEIIDDSDRQLSFTWHRHSYQIVHVSSAEHHVPTERGAGTRRVFLANDPNWLPPSDALSFDLTRLETEFSSDPIHKALRLFMLRYYGIKFGDKGLE